MLELGGGKRAVVIVFNEVERLCVGCKVRGVEVSACVENKRSYI